ncbi:TetR family transcriptional regulator [Terrilactibacillus sp. BCM23-1]|uniref:TetR family transcriptional regulator n=1 Tax=Terrilactibacillus tamarindi TaxID=2599694 RepID=A0A6N8CQF6_9BACI|nr:TetR/AcrR family transcriptional regulator [Terrilactibacillus tamarindi]MTT31407.1 TetR family transcriptional regulator [Terrilactibacillus tamarindi]
MKEQCIKESRNRKNELLTIAIKLFAEKGYHKTKISDIVKEAEVSQGTFYWYFKSKEAIALEIIQEGQHKLTGVISQGYRREFATTQDAVKASEKLFFEIFTFAEENRFLMELLLKGLEGESSIVLAINETKFKLERAFQKNIERAMQLQMLSNSNNAHMSAALLMSMIEGIIARWLFYPSFSDEFILQQSPEKLAKEVATFEFYGLLGN